MSLRAGAIEAMRRAGSGRHSRTSADAAAKLDALVRFLDKNIEWWCEASDDPMMDRDYPGSLLDVLRGSPQ